MPLVAVLAVAACAGTERSTASFCRTLRAEKSRLSAKYEAKADALRSSDDGAEIVLGTLVMVAGAMGDLVVYTDKLARTAPAEIQSEAEAVHQAFEDQVDAAKGAARDPLGSLASGLMSGLVNQGAMDDLNAFALAECGESI